MTPADAATTILTFDTTHHAMHAEQVAMQCGAGAQVIPAPAASKAKCDLALECLDEDVTMLLEALDAASVRYDVFGRSTDGRSGTDLQC